MTGVATEEFRHSRDKVHFLSDDLDRFPVGGLHRSLPPLPFRADRLGTRDSRASGGRDS